MDKASLLTPDWPAPANVRACITTRSGGVSSGHYARNNLALHVGDNSQQVEANRQQLCAQLSLSRNPQWLEQIHGIKVARARDDGFVRTADACYTTEPGLACVVMTADCLPILLCDAAGTQVAAVHAGWRGLAKGIVARAVQQFAVPHSVMAYLGPAISQPHFEVGVEVLEAFFKVARNPRHSEQVAAAFKPGQRPLHFFGDIYALARAELEALGVQAIYGGSFCTYAEPERFYSFRRDKVTGRMASLVWLADD
jgi:hypothetical protein